MASERPLIHIGGIPGGGKSRLTCELARNLRHQDRDAVSMSMGQRVRDIYNLDVISDYRGAVVEHARDPNHLFRPLSHAVATGIMLECLDEARQQGPDILLVDGFPRYWQQVEQFLAMCRQTGWQLVGSILAEVSPDVAYRRMLERESRPDPWTIDPEAAVNRLLLYGMAKYSLVDCLEDNGVTSVTIDTGGEKSNTDAAVLRAAEAMLQSNVRNRSVGATR